MPTMLDKDLEIVSSIFSEWNELEIIHKYDDSRKADDFKEALQEVLHSVEDSTEYMEQYKEDLSDHQKEKNEMLKHIKRLEKMLNKRGVKYKSWKEVSEDMYF